MPTVTCLYVIHSPTCRWRWSWSWSCAHFSKICSRLLCPRYDTVFCFYMKKQSALVTKMLTSFCHRFHCLCHRIHIPRKVVGCSQLHGVYPCTRHISLASGLQIVLIPAHHTIMNVLLIFHHLFHSPLVIVKPPENITAFLNKSAVFTCETNGGITSWRVNGTQRQILLPDIRSDLVVSEITTPEGTTVETLTIPARAQYNGTRVQCLSVIAGGPFVESDNATLTIQGITFNPHVSVLYFCLLP